MAVVYLARHVIIERLSAIKVLRQDLGMNASHRERFLREARAVNRINHPNIVEITDFGEDDGLVYPRHGVRRGRVAPERAQARPLHPLAARGPHRARRSRPRSARAHQMGVVHRDLKPENVLLLPPEAAERLRRS